jgi:hypothetical protein
MRNIFNLIWILLESDSDPQKVRLRRRAAAFNRPVRRRNLDAASKFPAAVAAAATGALSALSGPRL